MKNVTEVVHDSLLNVTDHFDEMVDDLNKYLHPRQNPFTRPIFVTRDAINDMVLFTFGNFTELITE